MKNVLILTMLLGVSTANSTSLEVEKCVKKIATRTVLDIWAAIPPQLPTPDQPGETNQELPQELQLLKQHIHNNKTKIGMAVEYYCQSLNP